MRTIEIIEYKGCTINVHQDETPENPLEAWGCEPPLLVLGLQDRKPEAYNKAPETWGEVLELLPASCFERGKRLELIKQLNCSLLEFAEESRNVGMIDALVEFLTMQCGATPSGWRDAIAWFEMAEWMLNWGGIAAVTKKSNGYSQGDSVLCLAIATPEWVELVGAPDYSLKDQLESAIKLYGWWAWGDVYGYTLEDENGDELDDSCWGFYGPHSESGLIEQAQSAIDSHLEDQATESQSLADAFSFA